MKNETRKGKWLISALLLWLAFAPLAQAFYNPSTGRWLSRDPIQEAAFRTQISFPEYPNASLKGIAVEFANSYAAVGNNPVAKHDYLGLETSPIGRSLCLQIRNSWIKKPNGEVPPVDGCSAPAFVPGSPDDPTGLCSFKPACDNHDICYSNCSASRSKCDKDWLDEMLDRCKTCASSMPSDKVVIFTASCTSWANSYYQAVDLFGEKAYNARQEKNCRCVCARTGIPLKRTQ